MVKFAMTHRVVAEAPVDALLFETRLNVAAVQRGTAAADANVRRKKPDR